MSYAIVHADCPLGSGRPWYWRLENCRDDVLYVRETFEVENPMGAWRRKRSKRKWKRVGVICRACGRVELDAGIPSAGGGPTTAAAAKMVGQDGPNTVGHTSRDGLPAISPG